MSEQWRPIPGYPDYEISDLGAIRRLTARGRYPAGHPIKAHVFAGKLVVSIREAGGAPRNPDVPRLVAVAFGLVAAGDRKRVVDYRDGDPLNARLDNLTIIAKSFANMPRGQRRGPAGTVTISDLAKQLGTSVKALQQAERRGQIPPAVRYGEGARTYRCYTPEQVAAVEQWRADVRANLTRYRPPRKRDRRPADVPTLRDLAGRIEREERRERVKTQATPHVEPGADRALALGLRRWTPDDPADAPFRSGLRNWLYEKELRGQTA